ncbi:hypothetical protein HFN89_03310 [Rhizobium laguerreae]|nr:hypothetical protein [Rhizobium laguerreae]
MFQTSSWWANDCAALGMACVLCIWRQTADYLRRYFALKATHAMEMEALEMKILDEMTKP